MVIYSYSRLETFKQCRLKFKYQYIDRVPREVDSIETFLGNRFHETMEKLYKDLHFRITSLEDLEKYFNEQWDKNFGKHVLISRSQYKAEDYRLIGLVALKDYYKRYYPFNRGKTIGVEKNLYLDLNGDGRYRIKCVIDRISDLNDYDIEIHDYKTSAYLPTQDQIDNDWQLALYELAVRQAWPQTKNVELIWHYVCFDKELKSHRTPEELEKLKKNIISLIDEIESTSEYPPSQSELCEWCSFQEICPLFLHYFEISGMPKEEYFSEDGVKLVNKYAELSARKSELNEMIKSIENEQEKVKEAAIETARKKGAEILYGSDYKLKIKNDIKIKYPESKEIVRPTFDNVVKELGLWERVSDINYAKLKQTAKEENWLNRLPQQLSPFVKIEPTQVVYLSKRKDFENEG